MARAPTPPGRTVRVAQVAGGDPFRERHRKAIDRARSDVARRYGLDVSVYVGGLDGPSPRAAAEKLLLAMGPAASDTVLIAVDPARRRSEVVSGPAARRRVDDHTAALVTMGMVSSFAHGDLAGGLVHGIQMLGEHARS